MTEPDRVPRCRSLPPGVVDGVAVPELSDDAAEAQLMIRLHEALSALPEDERRAVVAAHGYAEGAVGAAVELGLDVDEADAVARNALQLLRGALSDLDAHGHPRD
ncbi:MAG: hypothetical protein M3N21_01035 [Actinomycetota bacterium]|nr:hypothetical protein [Actinomycetota bacterium]